jgi:hypothetical protein
VHQPVALPFGLAHGVLAVEQRQLGPDGDIVGAQRGFQPRLVGAKAEKGRLDRPALLSSRTRSSTIAWAR